MPKEVLGDLLKPENKEKLAAVLTYHVVAGKVLAADVVKLSKAKTVQGAEVKITVKEGKVKVDDANVVKTDILCKNGVIMSSTRSSCRQRRNKSLSRPTGRRKSAISNLEKLSNASAMYTHVALAFFSVTDLPERMTSASPAAIDIALLWHRHCRHLAEGTF